MRTRARSAALATTALAFSAAILGTQLEAGARVNPLTTIARQILKPNVLIVLDTSSSMGQLPGHEDVDWSEAGVDCDNGDRFCRMVGTPGRCFYTASGRMGQGVLRDDLPCTSHTQCTDIAYCSGANGLFSPTGCNGDGDADEVSNNATCKGVCSHNLSTACTRDSNCGTGRTCRGMVFGGENPGEGYPTSCSGGVACPLGNACLAFPLPGKNFCVPAGSALTRVKMCRLQGSMCRTDADCIVMAGDSCGPASSRLVIAKRVLDNVITDFYTSLNFGFMTFRNTNYYPYYDMGSNPVTPEVITTFLSREQLEARNCFTTATGPAPTCTIHGVLYTRKAAPHSKYRLNKGAEFAYQDATWGTPATCTLECQLTDVGTGLYQGSYYTSTTYTGTPASGSWDGDHVSWRPTDYTTKLRNYSGKTYLYLEAPINRRNLDGIMSRTMDDPIDGGTGTTCTWGAGGWWEPSRWPFMDTSAALPAANAVSMLNGISRQLRKASQGGIYPQSGTPTACTLKNGGAGGSPAATAPEYSAYHYLQKVKTENAANNMACRPNYILFVTDGYPGGDLGCAHSDCKLDPVGPGCSSCRAIASARSLYKDLGVRVLAVGFSNAVTTGAGRDFLENLAYVGGTEKAHFANSEEGLREAINDALYKSLTDSYATSPVTVGASTIPNTPSTIVIDSRADFPQWKGHLIAYDTAVTPAALKWDAATGFDPVANPQFWLHRNVWTHDASGAPLKITMDAGGSVPNADKLRAAGLATTDAEATLVARWLLGDPAMKNRAVFGAVVNSTPTEVNLTLGSLTYVGASDGMLHAFHSRNQTINGVPYSAGREAFAYIPRDMLKVIRRLFAQGGQLPAPDKHIFGLANSPKVKKICVANCAGSGQPELSTVLVMPEGVGGSELFALDVGEPFGPTGVKNSAADPPMKLLWHSEHKNVGMGQSEFNAAFGQTISLPAFYYAKTAGRDEYRVIAASGYTDLVSTTAGLTLVNAKASSGEVVSTASVRGLGGGCGLASSEPTKPTVLADIGVARHSGAADEDRIAAAYVGDIWGNLFRYVPTTDATGVAVAGGAGTVSVVDTLSCNHPLHLSPTLVQIDRHNAGKYTGHIYIAQLTNSPFDPATIDVSASYPASQLIIRKDVAGAGSSITPDSTWGPSAGRIVLSVSNPTQICGEWNNTTRTCTVPMPAGARPISSSTGIIANDLESFALVTTWYVPTTGCVKNKSYITVHKVSPTETVSQVHGERLPDEAIVGAVFAGGNLIVVTGDGPRKVVAAGLGPLQVVPSQAGAQGGLVDRYRRMGWTEMP